MIKGIDLASYQGAPDFDKVAATGTVFGFTKVTEGETYTFPGFRRNRSEMQRVGMVPGMYHFTQGGTPVAEADYFLGAVGPLGGGEQLALDCEVTLPDPPGYCLAFLDRVYQRTGVRGWVYLNRDTVDNHNWGLVARYYPLWLAEPNGIQDFSAVPYWGSPGIKQYSWSGRVLGIAGKVDLDVFNGTVADLRSHGARSGNVPAPSTGADSLPTLNYGDKGPAVASLQRFLNAYPWKPALPILPVTGNYLDQTTEVLRRAQGQMNISGGDGRNVGPQTKSGLWDRGWRG